MPERAQVVHKCTCLTTVLEAIIVAIQHQGTDNTQQTEVQLLATLEE